MAMLLVLLFAIGGAFLLAWVLAWVLDWIDRAATRRINEASEGFDQSVHCRVVDGQ